MTAQTEVTELTLSNIDAPRGTLAVAAAQPMVVPGDVPENLRRMEPLVAEAAQRGAKLVLFSESALTAYDHPGRGVEAAIATDGEQIQQVVKMAKAHDIIIVTGFFEKAGDGLYNSVMAIAPDGSSVLQRKHIVTPGEIKYGVQAGPAERTLFSVNGVTFAIVICADSGMDGLKERLSSRGCDIVLAPTAGLGDAAKGYHLGDLTSPEKRAAYLKDAQSVCFSVDPIESALDHGLGMVSCNQMGYDARLEFFHCGHCMIVDTNAHIVSVIPGQFVFEHLESTVAVGTIHARSSASE